MTQPSDNLSPDQQPPPEAPVDPGFARRSKLAPLIMLLAAAAVIVPVMFWQSTWFGAKLTDERLREYLSEGSSPRQTQHALVRLAERMDQGEAGASAFYEKLPPLAKHERAEIRSAVAWVMGRDSTEVAFHDALRALVEDVDPIVRRNAALGLSNFGDKSCRPAILAMLEPFPFTSPAAGKITGIAKKDMPVRVGMNLATLTRADGAVTKLNAPLEGALREVLMAEGQGVSEGDVIVTIAPAEKDLVEALRALVRVGVVDDVAVIRRAVDRYGKSDRVFKQGDLTCEAIERRAAGETSG